MSLLNLHRKKMLAQNDNVYQRKVRDPLYGQLVIGPPGSGKTTYCHRITEFYKELERKVAVVNLDPANEQMNYNAEIDIVSFICHGRQKVALIFACFFPNLLPDEIGHRSRCDGTLEARPEWRPDVLHGIFGGELRLVTEPAEKEFGQLLHFWLPRPSGTLHTSQIDDPDIQ